MAKIPLKYFFLFVAFVLPMSIFADSSKTIEFISSGVQIETDDTVFSDFKFELTFWAINHKSFSLGLNGQYTGFGENVDAMPCLDIAGRYSIRMNRRFAFDISALGGAVFIDKKISPDVEISLEAKYFISPRWQFGITGGFQQIFDDAKTNVLGGGIFIEFRPDFHDEDNDWVDDKKDRCLDTPHKVIVDKYGCGLDSDGDGVFDGLDKCLHTPLAALVDSFGCPTDSDKDGVPDGVDRCADTPDNIPVDETGCPRDVDKDNVPDYIDSCANTPEGAIVDNYGCPIDSDEDGVPDGIDQCQKTPTGFEVDIFGCPTIPTANGMIIYDLFNNNLELTANAMNSLYRVVKRIRAYPDRITKISIYTDTEGSPKYNRNRARKVGRKLVEFLKKEGVDEDIVEIVPAGEKNPIIAGSSSKAKEKNRRAVFEVKD